MNTQGNSSDWQERAADNCEVVGSNPTSPTKFDFNADLKAVYKRLSQAWVANSTGRVSAS